MADIDYTKPKKASNQNGSFESYSIQEQIDADRYNKSKNSTSNGRNPWKMGLTKVSPPSCR